MHWHLLHLVWLYAPIPTVLHWIPHHCYHHMPIHLLSFSCFDKVLIPNHIPASNWWCSTVQVSNYREQINQLKISAAFLCCIVSQDSLWIRNYSTFFKTEIHAGLNVQREALLRVSSAWQSWWHLCPTVERPTSGWNAACICLNLQRVKTCRAYVE